MSPLFCALYADLTVQFTPFELNRKSLLTKLYSLLEHKAFDRDRLFIMVNMRSYFDHSEMEAFTESANLHGFRVLLLESTSQSQLKNTQRYTIDEDLCEFWVDLMYFICYNKCTRPFTLLSAIRSIVSQMLI